MAEHPKRASSSSAKTAARGSAKKATSTAKKATSTAKKATTSTAKKAASSSTKATRSAARKSTSAARKTASTARQAPKAIGDLTKPELVERLTAQLNKLKKDDLVGVVERVESGTLDLSRLGVSGEGGFGFQEHVRDESDDDRGGDGGGDGGGNKGLIPRAGEALRDVAEKIGDKI
jgi:hypothetical protein